MKFESISITESSHGKTRAVLKISDTTRTQANFIAELLRVWSPEVEAIVKPIVDAEAGKRVAEDIVKAMGGEAQTVHHMGPGAWVARCGKRLERNQAIEPDQFYTSDTSIVNCPECIRALR